MKVLKLIHEVSTNQCQYYNQNMYADRVVFQLNLYKISDVWE